MLCTNQSSKLQNRHPGLFSSLMLWPKRKLMMSWLLSQTAAIYMQPLSKITQYYHTFFCCFFCFTRHLLEVSSEWYKNQIKTRLSPDKAPQAGCKETAWNVNQIEVFKPEVQKYNDSQTVTEGRQSCCGASAYPPPQSGRKPLRSTRSTGLWRTCSGPWTGTGCTAPATTVGPASHSSAPPVDQKYVLIAAKLTASLLWRCP